MRRELGGALGVRREPTGYSPWSPGADFLVGGNNRGQSIAMEGDSIDRATGLRHIGRDGGGNTGVTTNEQEPAGQRSWTEGKEKVGGEVQAESGQDPGRAGP